MKYTVTRKECAFSPLFNCIAHGISSYCLNINEQNCRYDKKYINLGFFKKNTSKIIFFYFATFLVQIKYYYLI